MLREKIYIYLFYKTISFSLAPNLTVALTPSILNSDAADVDINLTCTAIVEEDIMLDEYEFIWMFNDAPVNQSDGSINV